MILWEKGLQTILEQENCARAIATSGTFLVQSRFSAFEKGLHTCIVVHTFQWYYWSKVASEDSQFPHFGTQKAVPTSHALTVVMPTPELVPCTFFMASEEK